MKRFPLKQLLIVTGIAAFIAVFFLQCDSSSDDTFIEELMEQMTLEEKIGQMTQGCLSTITANGDKTLLLQQDKAREIILEHHAGSFISGSGSSGEWMKFNAQLQRIAVEESRLGIPLLMGIDHVHGANYVTDGTILPHNINLACTFDTSLARQAGVITASETAPLGIRWNFAPVLDLGINPYWPRFYETLGEDPLVCSRLGQQLILGMEKCKVTTPYKMASCAKHFIGYSDPKSGWDRTPAEIPEQSLFEYFVPPFRAAVDAGVSTVMLNSGELNGEPVHTSEWILQDLLRQDLGFEGVVLTDIKDIKKIVELHSGAVNEKEATISAIEAGIDMSMACDSYQFTSIMLELVEEGLISEKRIDQSVSKILKLKKDLGLFEHPYPDTGNVHHIGCKEHRDISNTLARESLVLLKNDNLLPLRPGDLNILLAGHAVDSKRILNGAWTFEWLGAEEKDQPQNMNTLLESMQMIFGKQQIRHFNKPLNGSNTARFYSLAASADVIVLTAGEEPYSEFKGNITDLEFDTDQQKLIRAAINTGKPVVLVLLEGRPLLIHEFRKQLRGIVFAGIPGPSGGDAIAELLSGKINPSGKLAFSYPASAGHVVPYYHKPSETYTCEFPFGYGLSYSEYVVGSMTVSETNINKDQEFVIRVEVTNIGDIEGKETVLLYMHDHVGTLTRPVKILADFAKINLLPGETKLVEFVVDPVKAMAYPDKSGNRMLESGAFSFSCGKQKITVNLN